MDEVTPPAAATVIRCHYDVLGVEKDADEATIKKAYRKLALKYHPDKNLGNNAAEVEFLAVQQAYECLSDTAERKWYNEHREAILKGWTANGGGSGGDAEDMLFDVEPFMFAGCYRGFDEAKEPKNNFYAVYARVFRSIFGEELGSSEGGNIDYLDRPFGTAISGWNDVLAFYQGWESFSSTLSFAWADQWDTNTDEHRNIRRAMNEENKKARRLARKDRNDEILALVRFVKRRDPRVKEHLEAIALEKHRESARKAEEKKRQKEEQQVAKQEWKAQAQIEQMAMEEEDRLAGRLRLADLEDDDYDYGYGKKKKKGKKKNKGKQVQEEESDVEDTEDAEANGEERSDEQSGAEGDLEEQSEEQVGELTCTAAPDTLGEKDAAATIVDDNASEEDESEPDEWRCECCKKTFKSEGQMENHLHSKKHKVAWKKYEATL
jgi:DnaJ homolog subfamily A member 5